MKISKRFFLILFFIVFFVFLLTHNYYRRLGDAWRMEDALLQTIALALAFISSMFFLGFYRDGNIISRFRWINVLLSLGYGGCFTCIFFIQNWKPGSESKFTMTEAGATFFFMSLMGYYILHVIKKQKSMAKD